MVCPKPEFTGIPDKGAEPPVEPKIDGELTGAPNMEPELIGTNEEPEFAGVPNNEAELVGAPNEAELAGAPKRVPLGAAGAPNREAELDGAPNKDVDCPAGAPKSEAADWPDGAPKREGAD